MHGVCTRGCGGHDPAVCQDRCVTPAWRSVKFTQQPNDNYAYAFGNAFNYSQVPLKPAGMVQRPLPASAKRIHLTEQPLTDPS